MQDAFLLAGGLLFLIAGGEFLVRGAVQLAERAGLPKLLIGLTLVGFGTSTPELVTSVQAALSGSPGIALGNVVGSNIANVMLILGAAALAAPIAVTSMALKRDGLIGVAAAVLLLCAALTGQLDRWIGVGLVSLLVGYLVLAWRTERQDGDHSAAFDKAEAFEGAHGPGLHEGGAARPGGGVGATLLSLAFAAGGLVLLVIGGRLLVEGAIGLARALAVSEAVIGLTIVAVGTSLPELVTSLIAAARRQSDVALGNVLGSNIYNVLGIAGVTAVIVPVPVPDGMAAFDMPLMIAASLLLLLVARTGWRVGRREGSALLALYGVYVWAIWP